jgi:hypothetical protein
MTVRPGQKGTAGVEEVPDPRTEEGALLVRGRAVPLTSWTGALDRDPEDIKVVVDLTA